MESDDQILRLLLEIRDEGREFQRRREHLDTLRAEAREEDPRVVNSWQERAGGHLPDLVTLLRDLRATAEEVRRLAYEAADDW